MLMRSKCHIDKTPAFVLSAQTRPEGPGTIREWVLGGRPHSLACVSNAHIGIQRQALEREK